FSVAGVAVAALLLLFVLALYRGWSERLTSYLDDSDADLWIVQKGSESFFSPSIISENTVGLGAAYAPSGPGGQGTPGIVKTSSIIGRTVRVTHEGEKYDIYIMGFEAPREGSSIGGLGGPVRMKRGKAVPTKGEIVVDDVLARIAGIDIGDELTAGELKLRVVGISAGGNLGVSILCFVSRADGAVLVLGSQASAGFVNYILVQTEPGRAGEVKEAIAKSASILSVFEREQFAEQSREVLRKSVLPILGLVVGLVFIVGAIVVGLTIYTTTLEKEREFGVMKALGTPERRLMGVILEQSSVCSILGFGAGLGLVFGATRIAQLLVPQFVTLILWSDVALVFAATAVMSLVASILPAARILRVDPLTVFKA
ncbi:MAG: ABC transporter permease, partial [Dehalococcoidia bacterium]